MYCKKTQGGNDFHKINPVILYIIYKIGKYLESYFEKSNNLFAESKIMITFASEFNARPAQRTI